MNRFQQLVVSVALLSAFSASAEEEASERQAVGAGEAEQPVCLVHDYKDKAAYQIHDPSPPPGRYGAWETVIPTDDGAATERILGMQTVHTVMLPSGKVLMISGSSWRNLSPVQYYPEFSDQPAGTGLFVRSNEPFRMDRLAWYYQLVNHAAIYDPEKNTFYRIPHPVPVEDPERNGNFAPNDFFCTGHMHLPDGNILFTGGTQFYSPYRTGNRSTWIFDWRKELSIPWPKVDWRQVPAVGANARALPETRLPTAGPKEYPWTFAGFMKRGRWYPSLLPLLDGRMIVFSGFVGFDKDFPEMYPFEINPFVELYNPAEFDPANPQKAWKAIDVKAVPNSPFTQEINPSFKPTPEYVKTTQYERYKCDERCIQDNRFDAFKLYPENYLMPDGRIYMTREGDWVSLRTCDTAFMRKTRLTYFAKLVEEKGKEPRIVFEPGPARAEEITSYGTSLLDPNTGRIEILGGQPTSPGTLYPLNSKKPTHFAGGRGSRKRESFYPPSGSDKGRWELEENFLGEHPQDDRTMHYSLILPTRQVLIINGGNYDFYGPVYYPLLLTPQFDEKKQFKQYKQERMAEAVEPRLYHNTAILLPDASVLVSGGNTSRSTVSTGFIPPPNPNQSVQPKPDTNRVDLDVYFFGDGPMAKSQKGMLTTPTENWVAEIFKPPYLFIDKDKNKERRAGIMGLEPISKPKHTFERLIGGKPYYLLQSKQEVRVNLSGLPAACGGPGSLALIKLPSVTHGWDAGQRFVELPLTGSGAMKADRGWVSFQAPDARQANLPPAYYMLFYVDCKGKPSVAQMVRFDDQAREP